MRNPPQEDQMSIADFNRELKLLSLIDEKNLCEKRGRLKCYFFIYRLKSLIQLMNKIETLMKADKWGKAEKKFNVMTKRYFSIYNKLYNIEAREKIKQIRNN